MYYCNFWQQLICRQSPPKFGLRFAWLLLLKVFNNFSAPPPPWCNQKHFYDLKTTGCRMDAGYRSEAKWVVRHRHHTEKHAWLTSRMDGWQKKRHRRLIMPFGECWQRKSVWKSKVHLHLRMKAALRHCVKALGLSFEAYCIYSVRSTASLQSWKRSQKFISWALAILSDECDSCAVMADSSVCACVCGCAQFNAYHLALPRRGFLI